MVVLHRRSCLFLTSAGSQVPLQLRGIGEISLASPLQSRRRSIMQPGTVSKNPKIVQSSKGATLWKTESREQFRRRNWRRKHLETPSLYNQISMWARSSRAPGCASNVRPPGRRHADRQAAGTVAFAQDQYRFSTPNLGHTSMLTTDTAVERRAECRPSPGEPSSWQTNEVTDESNTTSSR